MNFLERSLDGQNAWWKYLVVILVSLVGGQLFGAIPLLIVIFTKTTQNPDATPDPANPMDLSAYGIDPSLGLFLLLFPFIISVVLYVPLSKALHKRKATEVINGTLSFRWSRFFSGIIVWGLLILAYYSIQIAIDPSNFEFRFDIGSFLPLLIVSLLVIPLQTSYEELLFRGYLSQGIAAWSRSRWLVVAIPSVLFALLHSFNPEVEKYGFWIMMLQYLTIGLTFAIASILDDGIEIALGAHAINNILMAVLVTFDGSALPTPAMFKQKELDMTNESVFIVAASFCFLMILKKRFQWNFKVLNQKVMSSE